jgi:hypothetical protein
MDQNEMSNTCREKQDMIQHVNKGKMNKCILKARVFEQAQSTEPLDSGCYINCFVSFQVIYEFCQKVAEEQNTRIVAGICLVLLFQIL